MTRVGAPRNLSVDGESAEQRDANQQQRRNRGLSSRGQQGYSRLVAQCGEIINAGKPQDLVPGVCFVVFLLLEIPTPEKPACNA